jgi:predicted dehydrogenase
MLRVGILGCGNFANMHAKISTSLPDDVELVAFSDCHEEKARAFSEQYTQNRAAVFTDHHTMFDKANLDLVLICLPPYGHTDEVEQAAEHGIHMLIEKPIALDAEQAWRMVEAVERTKIKTQVGFMFRFGEAIEQLKSFLTSGTSGPAGLMSARYFCNNLHAPWWRMKDKSGGQVVEQAIHMFDLLRYLLGDVDAVYSRQENLFHQDVEDYTIEDVSATVVSFKSGALGVVYATNGAIPGKWINDYRVVTQKITADFNNSNTATFYFTAEIDKPPLAIASEKDFRRAQMIDLIQAIKTDGETRTPMREGAQTLDLVLAAARSNELRTEVRL